MQMGRQIFVRKRFNVLARINHPDKGGIPDAFVRCVLARDIFIRHMIAVRDSNQENDSALPVFPRFNIESLSFSDTLRLLREQGICVSRDTSPVTARAVLRSSVFVGPNVV